MMMWYNGDHFGWIGWLLGSAVMVVFWALIITAIVLLVRYLVLSRDRLSRTDAKPAAGSRTAEDLLAERYARGEIDDEEYRRRLTLLRQSS
jgi:putative membrane protein